MGKILYSHIMSAISQEEQDKKEKEYLISKGFKQISEEKYKWESPQGNKFIYGFSAYDWQHRKDELEEKGYIFKIGMPHNGFGWNVFVQTEHTSNSYKMIHIMRDTREEAQADMDNFVQFYSQYNKEQALKYLQIATNSNNWSDNFNNKVNKILRVKFHHDTEYYSLRSYTDLVNICISFIKNIPIYRRYDKAPTKPSYEIENLPEEFKEAGQGEWSGYNKYLKEYNIEQTIFDKLEIFKNLSNKECKQNHSKFIDFVLDLAADYYGDIDIMDSPTFKKYI